MDLNLFENVDIPTEFKLYVNGDWEFASQLFSAVLKENQQIKNENASLMTKIDEKDSSINYLERKIKSIRLSNEKLRQDLHSMENMNQDFKQKNEEIVKLVETNKNLNKQVVDLKLKIDELDEDILRFSTKEERINNSISTVLIKKNLITKEDDNYLNKKKRNYENDNSIVIDLKKKIKFLFDKIDILHKDNVNLRNQIRIFNYASKLNCVNSNKLQEIENINIDDLSSFRENFEFN